MATKDIQIFKYKKGQSGNPNGRPRKLVSIINKELEKAGIERVTPSQVATTYEQLFNVTFHELKEMISKDECPMLIKIVGANMLTKNGILILESMLDRAHGKPTQSSNVQLSGELNSTIRTLIRKPAEKEKEHE